MSYTFDFSLSGLTPGLTDLRAQLLSIAGVNVGSAISTGFADHGDGFYQWHGTIPAGHQGAVKFYRAASPATTLGLQAINPAINEIWSQSPRTLTQSAAQVAAAVQGSTVTVTRGDNWSIPLTDLGSLSDYVSLDFTVKLHDEDTDTEAILRVRNNFSGSGDGLLRLNAGVVTAPANGSLTINDINAGDITLALTAAEAAKIDPGVLLYDVQKITASGVITMTAGVFVVEADITRAVA